MDSILEFLVLMGIPTAITGLLVWWLKRHIDKRDQKAAEKEAKTEQLILLIMQTCRATYIVSEATAKAVQRIPDAHCNGDMTSALEKAAQIQQEEQQFIIDQGVKHIFGD